MVQNTNRSDAVMSAEAVLHLVDILRRITTRDEAGKHFTAIYAEHDLDALEEAGLIHIDRPVHQPSGIPYSQEHWTVDVTDMGFDYIEAYVGFNFTGNK